MQEFIEANYEEAEEHMSKAIEHLQAELVKIRTGKASPAMLGGIMVPYYGNPTPLHQVANIATSDARTLVIQPWEKNMLGPIEKAIFETNMGITPMNDGEVIRLAIPPLTEERRKDMVKQAKALGEDGKVSLRSTRHKAIDFIKKSVKDGYPEDAGKRSEKEVDDLIHTYNEKIDKLIENKEKDIMTV